MPLIEAITPVDTRFGKNVLLFLFSVAFVFGTAACFSVFESNQAMGPTFISGSLTQDRPINIFYFTSHFLLAELYMGLYAVTAGIPWYEIAMYLYAAVALFVLLYLFWEPGPGDPKWRRWLLAAAVLVLATEFYMLLEYTRIAFALGGASTLWMLSGKKRPGIPLALFVLCILTRPEVGVFVLLIQWLAFLLLAEEKTGKKALVLNTLVLFLVMGYITYDRITTDDITKQFEPELGYQLLDRGNIVPLSSMPNAVDSAKYTATVNMISDPEYTSIDFLRSLVGQDPYVGINAELLQRFVELVKESVDQSLGPVIIYLVLFLYGLWQYVLLKRKRTWRYLLFHAAVWAVLAVTVYLIKMETWVFSSVMVLLSLLLLSQLDFGAMRRTYPVAVLAALGVVYGTGVLFAKQRAYADEQKAEILANARFYDEVKKRYPGTVLMPGLKQSQMVINSILPFQMPDFSVFKRIYLFDSDVLYLEANYNAYLSAECGCHAGSYTNFMDFLVSKREEVTVVSSSERTDLMAYYCRVVRGKEYTFEPIDSISTDNGKRTATVFKLR